MLFRLAAAGVIAAVAGCAAPPPPPPPPTVVNVTLTTSQDVNMGPGKQGEPIELRLYQLAAPTNFAGSEFFALYGKDDATLGTDLVKKDKVTLPPGQSKTMTLSPNDQVKAIGFLAGYRDFANVTWRGTADIPPHQTTNITVTAGAAGLTVKAVSVPPPPPKPGS
jgi:type VI secretion system protein VasD